jgi:hypothetical protein
VIEGLAIQVGDNGREIQALCAWATLNQVPRRSFHRVSQIPPGWIAAGSVEWVTAALGISVIPDYYPDFLSPWFHRRVWKCEKWPLGQRVFVKPADRYKRFTGFVNKQRGWKGSKRGPLWCSEEVQFINEWRYYVADGNALAAHWYAGDEAAEPPAPLLDIVWPDGWCGAADFGTLPDGRIALVEAQHPFSCGWYGSIGDGAPYARWIEAGWRYMKKQA